MWKKNSIKRIKRKEYSIDEKKVENTKNPFKLPFNINECDTKLLASYQIFYG